MQSNHGWWQRLRQGSFNPERLIFAGLFAITAVLVAYPLGALVFGTFQSSDGTLNLAQWRSAAETPLLWMSLRNTVVTSLLATLLALVLGLLLAFLATRTDTPFRNIVGLVTLVPFITPPFVGALAWVILADPQVGALNWVLHALGIPLRLNIFSGAGLVWVLGLFTAPLVFFVCASGLSSFDPALEEAARTCGAGRIRITATLTLPLILPAIGSAALLSFMTSSVLFGVHSVIGIPANIPVLTTSIYQVLAVIPINYQHAAVLALLLLALGGAAALVQRLAVGTRSYWTVTGRGTRAASPIRLGRWRWVAGAFVLVYICLVVVLPYGIIFLRSLSPVILWQARSVATALSDISLSNYSYLLFENPTARRALVNSLLLGCGAATATTILGGLIAHFTARRRLAGCGLLEFMAVAPLAVPGIVFGVALLGAYSKPPVMLYGTMSILFIAYLTKELPIVYRASYGALRGLHPELEESARMCGASWIRRTWEITVKLAKPSLVVAWILVFASILREIGTSIILASFGTEVIATVMFNFWEEGLMQHVSALAVLSVALVLLLLWLVRWVFRGPFEKTLRSVGA